MAILLPVTAFAAIASESIVPSGIPPTAKSAIVQLVPRSILPAAELPLIVIPIS